MGRHATGFATAAPIAVSTHLSEALRFAVKLRRAVLAQFTDAGNCTRRHPRKQVYWFTPLARKPPSTTRISPVTNADASLAR